jgi:hypothetical protein
MRARLLLVGAMCFYAWAATPASAITWTYSPSRTVQAVPFAVVAGQPFTLALTNMSPCPQSATVDWGTGQTSPVQVIPASYGGCTLEAGGTLSQPGPLTAHVTTTWDRPDYFTGPYDIPIDVAPWSFTARAHKGVAATELDWTVAQFAWSSASAASTATADWGDGQSGPITVRDGGIFAKHTYASAGTYPIKVDLFVNGVRDGEVTTRAVISGCGAESAVGDAFVPPLADANSRWLAGLYHDVLGRPIDEIARADLARQLAVGTRREQIARSILDSSEARTVFMKATYSKLLGRAPTDDELGSGAPQNLFPQLLASDEYYDLGHPESVGPELADLVGAASCDLLGRRATAAERTAVNDTVDRNKLIASMLGGAEYRLHAVDMLYERYLRRAPTPAERVAGIAQSNLAATLLASAEYFRRANNGGVFLRSSITRNGRLRLVVRTASILRLTVIRNGRRLGTVSLGRHARGPVDIHWTRRLSGHTLAPGTYELVLEAWSHGRLVDVADPTPLTIA